MASSNRMSRIECGADEGSAQRELLRAPRDAGCAGRAPGDVLASVFELLNVRDRGSCRLVCRSWREFCDSTVHRLVLRCPLHTPLLGRFPLLHSCSLGSAVTSDGRAFATSISLLSALSLLVRLHLSFPCPAAVRLPSALHGLTRLTSLAVSISGDASAWAGATSSTTSSSSSNSSALAGPGRAARPSAELPPGIGHRGSVASSNSGASSNSSSTHRLSAVLCGLVAALPRLSTLELLNCPVSAGQLLAAAATAANAPPSACASPPGSGPVGGPSGASCSAVGPCQRSGCRGAGGGDSGGCCGLRVLVLVGSCVDLTGLASGAARRQLAGLEALHLDGCTGADSLVPLLPGLTRLQHLSVSGMDYAWAAAAGYHRPLGATDSAVDLQHLLREAEGQRGRGQGRQHRAAGGGLGVGAHGVGAGQQRQHGVGGGVGVAEPAFGEGMGAGAGAGPGGGGEAGGDDPLALLGAGRPLVFLWSLTGLTSLNLQGNFLRSLPGRSPSALCRLTALDLASNGLDDLPHGLSCLVRLQHLDLSHNDLSALPQWMTQLARLRSLSLHHNSFERFPPVLYELPALTALHMSHNRISWWPLELRFMQQQHFAHQQQHPYPHPHLPHLPAHVDRAAAEAAVAHSTAAYDAIAAGSPSHRQSASSSPPQYPAPPPPPPLPLRRMDLSHNRLFGLPSLLPAALPGLTALKLRNTLAGMDPAGAARAVGVLAGLTQLQELDLSSNRLDQHALVCLSELVGLRQLGLADNGLAELPLGLARLSRLTHLSLRANRFCELPVCLRWLGGLEVLDLSANSLEGLPGWMGPPAAGGLGGAGASGTGATGTARTGTGTGAAGAAAAVGVCACCGGQPRRTSFDAQEGYSAGGGGGGPGPGGSGSARAASIGGGGGSGGGRGGGGAGCSHCGPGHSGLLGLRHLDVSQQFRVLLRDSPNPRVPTRLEVQPPHCLYGPIQGDLPDSLLRLPRLRSLTLQRHPLAPAVGSRVLRRLQARGVDVVHPRPLRVDCALSELIVPTANGHLHVINRHNVFHNNPVDGNLLQLGADWAGHGLAAAAAAAGAAIGGLPLPLGVGLGIGGAAVAGLRAPPPPRPLGLALSAALVALVAVSPVCVACVSSALGLPLPPALLVAVVLVMVLRLAVQVAVARAAATLR